MDNKMALTTTNRYKYLELRLISMQFLRYFFLFLLSLTLNIHYYGRIIQQNG